MKKILLMLLSIAILLTVFNSKEKISTQKNLISNKYDKKFEKGKNFSFTVNPNTFEINILVDSKKEQISKAFKPKLVENYKENTDEISWRYPDEKISVRIQKIKQSLDISIKAEEKSNFTWPNISSSSYYMPWGEGKNITNDENWRSFLNDKTFNVNEWLSMKFFSVNFEKHSAIYIIKDMTNSRIKFKKDKNIDFEYIHDFTSIKKNKEYGFKIYITENNPVDVAKIYRNYLIENKKFKTLKEKASENMDIKKLYGAIQIYWWNKQIISKEDIFWNKLNEISYNEEFKKLDDFIKNSNFEYKNDFENIAKDIKKNLKLDNYQKKIFVDTLNYVLMDKHFSNLDSKDLKVNIYEENKRKLKNILKTASKKESDWSNENTIDILTQMKKMGINRAWIGFDDYEDALRKKEFVKYLKESFYLIAPYDSYHSIQKKDDKNSWSTAIFDDESLYDKSTITNEKGEKISGFLSRGRQLNPKYSIKSVKNRIDSILKNNIGFNSWFIDCDAAGEVFDDYTKNHITTQQEDVEARIKRMNFIKNNYNVVIGSEGGCDYAAESIAFAHGVESPVISDFDMRRNKNSKYYLGNYWGNNEIPPRYVKKVEMKDLYKELYFNSKYQVPLYRLVFNDSLITSNHWEQGSLKFKNLEKISLMKNILYNTSPLYHIDKNEWLKNNKIIVSHFKIWSNFSKKALDKEMTDFKYLDKEKNIQMTEFTEELKVVANFSKNIFKYKNFSINPNSLIIIDKDKIFKY